MKTKIILMAVFLTQLSGCLGLSGHDDQSLGDGYTSGETKQKTTDYFGVDKKTSPKRIARMIDWIHISQ